MRCASLGIPAGELGQVTACRVLERGKPILDRGGLSVVTVEIQRAGGGIGIVAHYPAQHANHLGALFIDGCGVEIVDLDHAGRAHGMGEGAAVLSELVFAHHKRVFDPFDGVASHIACELLVAVNRQPLFQTQLEPVAAGNPVACPIVEIFMGNNRFDPFKIRIACGLGRGQNARRVKDIQPFVFHRAHVEIIDGHDVEHIQIVFAAICVFIPCHRRLERLHRKGAFVQIPVTHVDIERDIIARHRGECIRMGHKVTPDQREQIGGFGPRIMPDTLRHGVPV